MSTTQTISREVQHWRAWRKSRDHRAFEALVRPEIRHAVEFARRCGAGAAEAQDLVQKSLVKLARENSDDPVLVGVRAWLCRRVALGCRMHVRASVRRRKHERGVPERRASPDPTRRVEVRDQVEHALSHLDDDERRVLVLRYLDDLDYREIAYVLGTTQNACRIRVHKALKRLRSRLGPKAATLVAALGVPEFASAGTVISVAVKAGAGIGLGLKAGAAVVAAVAVATTLAALPEADAPLAAPVVVEATPPAAPEPPPPALAPEPASLPDVASAIELLEYHFDGKGDVGPALWDPRALVRLVPVPGDRTTTVGASGDVTDVNLYEITRSSDRLVLGPGRFRIVQPIPGRRERPFEIRGAGADKTEIFVPNHDLFNVPKGSRMEGVIIRDLTFDGRGPTSRRGGGLLGVRGTAVALIQRVRFQRWPDKAGYGSPIGISGPDGRALVIYGNCDFVGGYWSRPGGNAITVRGGGLVLLDRCRFFDLSKAVSVGKPFDGSRRSTVNLRRCRFVNTKVADIRLAPRGRRVFPVRVRDAEINLGKADLPADVRLGRWGKHLLAEATGIRSGPAVVRCRVSEFSQALSFVRVPRGYRVSAVQALVWEGSVDRHYGVLLVADGGDTITRIVRRGAGGLSLVDPSLFPHLRFATPELPFLGPDVRDVLPDVARYLGRDTPVRSLSITPGPTGRNALLMYEDDRVVVIPLEFFPRRPRLETEPK
jgi:RNA polymerase sigma-70 factor, ECF subfamily